VLISRCISTLGQIQPPQPTKSPIDVDIFALPALRQVSGVGLVVRQWYANRRAGVRANPLLSQLLRTSRWRDQAYVPQAFVMRFRKKAGLAQVTIGGRELRAAVQAEPTPVPDATTAN
jgi:hypothetical protein